MIEIIRFGEHKDFAFIKCPVCKREVFIETDKWQRCKKAYDEKHKSKRQVFKLKQEPLTVIYVDVKNFGKQEINKLED